MDVWVKRTLSGLAADDGEAEAWFKRWPLGLRLRANVRRPRNHRSLNRWWALCSIVSMNSQELPSKESVSDFLKIQCGHFLPIIIKSTGEVVKVPNSISFDAIDDEHKFEEIWLRAIRVVCEEILPGIDSADLELEILKLIGAASANA